MSAIELGPNDNASIKDMVLRLEHKIRGIKGHLALAKDSYKEKIAPIRDQYIAATTPLKEQLRKLQNQLDVAWAENEDQLLLFKPDNLDNIE